MNDTQKPGARVEREPRLIPDRDYRMPSACGLAGIMNRRGTRFSGEWITRAMASLHERSNGLGGGFAAYGIYPEHPEEYAFHLLYDAAEDKKATETLLAENYTVILDEPIPTRQIDAIQTPPILWRYFLRPRMEKRISSLETEEDFVVRTVMEINRNRRGTFIASSGKNMGIFKGVGYPEELAEFYRLEEYKGYIWTGHGRFPTNTPGWWGGAHPFGLLDWSVVHNGEISSYGTNRRYLKNFGYDCLFYTDTEVIAYLFDLLHRKHEFDFSVLAKILAAPLWDEIERTDSEGFFRALRIIYAGALLNGPFAVIAANGDSMVGLNDRIKLRPLVAGEWEDFIYVASEESAIREICPDPDRVWAPEAGEPVIGRLRSENG